MFKKMLHFLGYRKVMIVSKELEISKGYRRFFYVRWRNLFFNFLAFIISDVIESKYRKTHFEIKNPKKKNDAYFVNLKVIEEAVKTRIVEPPDL